MLKKDWWFYLAMCYSIFVAVISLIKLKAPEEINVPLIDKWAHFGIYFVFTILWFAYFYSKPKKPLVNKPLLKSALWALMFGVVIEILQYLNPIARSGDLLDVLANSIGVVLAIFVLKKTRIIEVLK